MASPTVLAVDRPDEDDSIAAEERPADTAPGNVPPGNAPPLTDAAPADFDPVADAQRRLDEMLDILRRERLAACPPAPSAAAAAAVTPSPAPASEPPPAEIAHAVAPILADSPAAELIETNPGQSEVEEREYERAEEAVPAAEALPVDEAELLEVVAGQDAAVRYDPVPDTERSEAQPAPEPSDAAESAAPESYPEPYEARSPRSAVDPFQSLAGLGLTKPDGAPAPQSGPKPPLRSLLSEMFDLELSGEDSDEPDGDEAEVNGGPEFLASMELGDRRTASVPTAASERDSRGDQSALCFDADSADEPPTDEPQAEPAAGLHAEAAAAPWAERAEPAPETLNAEDESAPHEPHAGGSAAVGSAPIEPAPADSAEAGAAVGSVEESVDDYMQALLARMRQARGEEPARREAPPKPVAPKPAATAVAAPAASASAVESTPVPPETTALTAASAPEAAPLPSLPPSRVNKEKLREEMRQLRAIANTSARSAVMESTWKQTRARLVLEVLMCGVSLGLGLVLIVTSVWGSAVHYGLGGALCLAALWIARDFGRTVDLLRRQKIAATKDADADAAEAGLDPRQAQERALNVPAGDGSPVER